VGPPSVRPLQQGGSAVTVAFAGDGESADREELRQAQARFDARFQAVSARFTVTDRRHAAVTERLEGLELHVCQVTEHLDKQDRTVENRFDAMDTRVDAFNMSIDRMQDHLASRIDQATRQRGRMLVYTVVAVGAAVAVIEAAVLAVWGWLT
jgi:hypothetical protein